MPDSQPELPELERLFRDGKLSRRQFVAGLMGLGVGAGAIELLVGSHPIPAEAQSATPKYLVIIVLDAFRADYLSLYPMSSFTSLARSGVSYDRAWVGQLESVTPVGHATISTGSLPRSQGVIGFEWKDSVTGLERYDAWAAGTLAGDMERDLRESGVPSIPLAVKAANPHARVVALSSEKVYAADAMGGWAADYTLYLRNTGKGEMVTAGLPGHLPPPGFLNLPNLKLKLPLHHFTDWDYLSGMMAVTAVQQFKPQVLMVNLPGTDVYGHLFGGPATPSVTKQVIAGQDRNITRILNAYKQAGIFDQTLFVITSDHGMTPNDRAVDRPVVIAAVKQAGAQYYFHTGGTAAHVYIHDDQHAPAVAAALHAVPGVASAYYLAAKNGQFDYFPAAGMKIDSALDAANQHLLSTFVGPTAPAIVAPYRENTIGQIFKNAHGDHGGLEWGSQQIPLVISGPGVPMGVVSHHPARLMDVAPTVLRLLGLPGMNMDGIVLADAVLSRTAQEVSVQAKMGSSLTPHQDALKKQALQNIQEDARTGHQPPPSRPIRP
jgi:predicted AlkP superfamily pyrophosphatase or phosphodiesterase